MSAIINDPTLQIYLKLDRLSEAAGVKTTTDFSKYKKVATIKGTPTLASDDQFANSLQWSGAAQNFVEFDNPFANNGAFTLSIWAWPDAINDGTWHGIMGHQGTQRKPSMFITPGSKGLHYDSYAANGQRFTGDIPNFFETAKEWVHIAWVKEGAKYLFYRNGILFHSAAAPDQFAYIPTLPYQVGGQDTFFWKGRLARARVYSRALSAEEIGWDMDEDRTAMAAFRSTHPVSFLLSSNGNENVLYIVGDPAKQTLNVAVQNDSRDIIDFEAAAAGDAGPDAHHFSLHFRPGALAAAAVAGFPNVALPGWKKGVVRRGDGGVILYFLKTAAFSLTPGQTVAFDLTGFSADPKGGARNTTVELHFREKPAYTANDKLPSRYRSQQISIVNHLGQTHFPVHFGPMGTNTVLNDGASSNSLVFHLANLLPLTDPARPEKAYLRFKGKTTNPTDYTKIVLSFETQLPGKPKEWALCKSEEVAGVQPQITGWVQDSVELNTESPKWTFRRDADLDLKSGEFLNILLTGIKSSLPTGLTRFLLRYENVAGYWDGQLTAPVEKSPIVIRNGNIGIGRAIPEVPLDINVDIKLERSHTVSVDYGPWAWVNEKLISFEVPYKNDPSRGLVHLYAPTNYYENVPALTLAGNYGAGGKVGIGTKDPEAMLDVAGDARINGLTINKGATNDLALRLTSTGPGWGSGLILANTALEGREYGLYADPTGILHLADNNAGIDRVRVYKNGAVGIGMPAAAPANNMAGGSLTIGATDQNFGGGNNWNANTAGLMLECAANTEIAVHYSNTRLASLLHYEGDAVNRITMGRDMGWGKTNVRVASNLRVEGDASIHKLFLSENYEVTGDTNVLNVRGNTNTNSPLIFAENKGAGWVFYAHSNVGRHYGNNSSIQLKQNVRPIEGALEKVLLLEGVRFEWKENNREDIGFIAEEVGKQIPEGVTFGDDGFATGMSYNHVTPLLVEAVKAQQKMIDQLSKQVEALTELVKQLSKQ